MLRPQRSLETQSRAGRLGMHLFFVKDMEVLYLLRHSTCYLSLPRTLYRHKEASPSLVTSSIKRSVSGASKDFSFLDFFFFFFSYFASICNSLGYDRLD